MFCRIDSTFYDGMKPEPNEISIENESLELDFLGIDESIESIRNGDGNGGEEGTEKKQQRQEQGSEFDEPKRSSASKPRQPRKQNKPVKRKDTKDVMLSHSTTKFLIPRLSFKR